MNETKPDVDWDYYDTATNVSIDYLVLADAAEVQNGKLYIHSAAWDSAVATELPTNIRWAIALRVRIPWEETNREHNLVVDVVDSDNQSILKEKQHLNVKFAVGRPPNIPIGIDQCVPMAFDMSRVSFPKADTYNATLALNGRWVSRSAFHLYEGPPTLVS